MLVKLKRLLIIVIAIIVLSIMMGGFYKFFLQGPTTIKGAGGMKGKGTPPPQKIIPKNNKCTNVKCQNNGVCDLDTGWCSCTNIKYTGALCDKEKEKCTKDDCSNNGIPRTTYSLSPTTKECNCKCKAGFIGDDCSKSKCPECLDLSKSKCALKKTCIKKGDKWLCIKNHYLHHGNTADKNDLDCLPCPEGTTIPDSSYNGENKLSQCKCIAKDGGVDNKYMDIKTKKCESCISKWKIKSGMDGKKLKKPKDKYGNGITDWILYDKETKSPTGTDKDCKCNNNKHYYNSESSKNTCVKCFQGAKLTMLNGVEICKCDSPDWQMIFVPFEGNKKKLVPKCVLNETCKNPTFDPSSNPVHYCANPSYFGKDFTKEETDLAGNNYTKFAHPETGQVKCSLLETEEEKDARIIRETSSADKMGNMVNTYLEQGEKLNTVNTMIDKSTDHISKNEFEEAIRILNNAKLISLGYNGLDDKSKWVPFSFKTSGRIETISPPLVDWGKVQAKELKQHLIGRIVFRSNDIESGKIIEGATLQLLTKCGTNKKNKIIKVDKVSKNINNPGVIPEEGDNLDKVPSSNIKGDDCTFVRIKDIKTETSPVDELDDKIKLIDELIKEAEKKSIEFKKKADELKKKEDELKLKSKVAAENAAINKMRKLKLHLNKLDFKTGCIDTPAGNEITGFNGERECINVLMNDDCESEFAIRNCRKTCEHNHNTCKEEKKDDILWEDVKDYGDNIDEYEGFKNSWEEF